MAGKLEFQDRRILKSFNKLSPVNKAVILVVGAPGVGKNQLARAILSSESTLTVEVRTATSLPLPEENAFDRPRIDFVVMMIDLTNRDSYLGVKKSLLCLDVTYFIGKICFVIANVGKFVQHCVALESVIDLAEAYHAPWLSYNVQSTDENYWLAVQLLNKVKLSLGLIGNTSFLEVEATDQMYQIQQDEQNLTTLSRCED